MSKLKNQRFFLNAEADSYVRLYVPDRAEYRSDYDLKLADCSRHINWSFPASTKKDRKSSMKKLNKLRYLVNMLYEELEGLDK